MNILELFAGSRSLGIEAEKLGHNVFSVDWTNYENIDLVTDIGNLQIEDIPFIPDMVWASPDCTTYSIAACSTHRINSIEPKSDYAKTCDIVNKHWIDLIRKWLLVNPNLIYYIENPRGMLRKMPFMTGIPRVTIWYCKYGDNRAKPTDIWSNNIRSIFNQKGWQPRPECHNGNKNCHNGKAPRGLKTGTQGRKDSYNRSKIPKELCIEILMSL